MNRLPWISFQAKLPTPQDGPIVVISIEMGANEVGEIFNAEHLEAINLAPDTPFYWADAAIYTVVTHGFGVALFKDAGRGKEISSDEYADLLRDGWWLPVSDLIRQTFPTGDFLVTHGSIGTPGIIWPTKG